MACENSEVSPVLWSVAVAVTTCPLGTFLLGLKGKVASLLESVVTLLLPLNFLPSPWLEGSASRLEKNCKVNVVSTVLFSVPLMVVARRPVLAKVMTGKFCRLLGPASLSPGSLE